MYYEQIIFKMDHCMKWKLTIGSLSNHKNVIIPKINKPINNLMGNLNQTKTLQKPDNMYSRFVALHWRTKE
jgi:hypothetical protein